MEQEKDKAESHQTIYDLWMKKIFVGLQRLEEYERLAVTGCSDILEYCMGIYNKTPDETTIDLTRYKNAQMFFKEFEMMLSNVEKLLTKEEFEYLKGKLKNSSVVMRKKVDIKGVDGEVRKLEMYHNPRNDITKKKGFKLTDDFELVRRYITSMRNRLVQNLGKILYAMESKEEIEKKVKAW